MNWERLERWITRSLYIAAGTALVIVLTKRFAPEEWLIQRLAKAAAEFLDELGSVSGGVVIVIILSILGGNWFMSLIFRGVDMYRERKDRDERMKAEALEAGLAEGRATGLAEGRVEGHATGRAEGRAEARAEIRERLLSLGIDPEEILPPDEPEQESQES